MSSEGFRWFEVSSTGVQGALRGSIALSRVAGAVRAGEWNGCAAARVAAAGRGKLTAARRMFGVEMQHPGVEKDVTVLWCKSAAERDVVGARAARRVSNLADTAAAGHGCRHQQHATARTAAAAAVAAVFCPRYSLFIDAAVDGATKMSCAAWRATYVTSNPPSLFASLLLFYFLLLW